MHGKEANLPQKRSANGGRSSPAKVRCPEARVKPGTATVEESEAIAALEDFRSAGKLLRRPNLTACTPKIDFCSAIRILTLCMSDGWAVPRVHPVRYPAHNISTP